MTTEERLANLETRLAGVKRRLAGKGAGRLFRGFFK